MYIHVETMGDTVWYMCVLNVCMCMFEFDFPFCGYEGGDNWCEVI